MNNIQAIRKKVETQIDDLQNKTDEIAEFNQAKVLDAFQENKVSDFHFHPSTGYGYDDEGRDTLERVYATVFKTEAALVRPQIISGTMQFQPYYLASFARMMNYFILLVNPMIR